MRRAARAAMIAIAIVASVLVVSPAAPAQEQTPARWLAVGDSYSSGEGIPGTSPERDPAGKECSRADGVNTNATAWSVGAQRRLVDAGWSLSAPDFVACTGAIVDEVRAQIDEATDESGVRRWEISSFSFGGNSIGFADVLLGCLDLNSVWGALDFTPGCDVDEARMKRRVDMLVGSAPIVAGEYQGSMTFPALLDTVAASMHPGGDVMVLGYPNLVEEVGRWPAWRRVLGTCAGLLEHDVPMLRSVLGYLNEQLANAVRSADERHSDVTFHWVDISRDAYETAKGRHGLCSSDPWLNGVTVSIRSGDLRKERSFHPHQGGHTGTAEVLATRVERDVTLDDVRIGIDEDALRTVVLPNDPCTEYPSDTYDITREVVMGDVSGDGVDEAAVLVRCGIGAGTVLTAVHVFDADLQHLGEVPYGDRMPSGQVWRPVAFAPRIADGVLHVKVSGWADDDTHATPSIDGVVRFRVDGSSLRRLDPDIDLSAPLTPAGLGAIRVPSAVGDLAEATSSLVWLYAINDQIQDDYTSGCAYVEFLDGPSGEFGFYGLASQGELLALVTLDERVRTERGVGVGSSLAEIEAAYPGETRREDNIYTEVDDVYVGGGPSTLRFQLDETTGRATRLHAGEESWVGLAEGCA